MNEENAQNDNYVKLTAVCSNCRHHGHNPTVEFNFSDSKIYWLCQECKSMNIMDLSKPLPGKFPKLRKL